MGEGKNGSSGKGFTINDQRWWLKEDAEPVDVSERPSTLPTYVEDLQARLAEKDRTLREYIQAHKSSVADMDEARARLERELDRRLQIEKARLAAPFVEVQDNLRRLVEVARASEGGQELAQGVQLIVGQFEGELKRMGLEPIPASGCRFDPKVMEALMTAEVEEEREGMVVEEIRPGYKLQEQVVRPAGVRVGVARKG